MSGILIVGAGAVGQYLGRLWLASGRTVTFAARFGCADRLEKASLPLLRLGGQSVPSGKRHPASIIVLAVGGHELKPLLPIVRDLANSSAKVLVLARDPLTLTSVEQVFRGRTVATVLEGAVSIGPTGRLKTLAAPPRLEIGCESAPGWLGGVKLHQVASALNIPSLPCVISRETAIRRGTIFMQSLLTESIAMLLRAPPAMILSDPDRATLQGQFIDEIARGAWRARVRFDAGWFCDWELSVASGGWAAHALTLEDLQRYKTLEFEHLVGAIRRCEQPSSISLLALAVRSASLYRRNRDKCLHPDAPQIPAVAAVSTTQC